MRTVRLPALIALVAALSGCEEDKIITGGAGNKVQRQAPAEETAAGSDLPAPMDFQEAEFVESDRSRDPFRSFARTFLEEARSNVKSQREVVLEQYTVDELRLVGIVTRINPPKALLVDPTGLGHMVHRGQFIGRPSVIQPASGVGAAYEVNWRIDRIRDGDIVLIREDPANPDVPSATRVIALRSDDEGIVTAGEGNSAADTEASLDRQVEELKRRLESVEQRRTTVEVRDTTARPQPAPQESSAVVRAPGN